MANERGKSSFSNVALLSDGQLPATEGLKGGGAPLAEHVGISQNYLSTMERGNIGAEILPGSVESLPRVLNGR